MTTLDKKPKSFPKFESLFREHFKKKEERNIIKEFNRLKFSIQEFCKIKKYEQPYIKRLLSKYGVKEFQKKYSYNEIYQMVKDYSEVKYYYKKMLLIKWDISYTVMQSWKKHFLVHKDKDTIKVILIDKEWEVYKEWLREKEKLSCPDSERG